jgi:apolipoprotein N-acyltransferase
MTWGEIKWTKARWVVAAAAGLLLAAAFPNWNIAGFAWIAPGLMLLAALGSSGSESFRIGFVAGLGFWLGSLYWLLYIPVAGFPILGWIALSAYVALFQGVWVWLCWKCFPTAATPAARDGDLPSALNNSNSATRLTRFSWALLCAALWVALEMIRTRFLSGFPWSLLGVSQYQMTPLLQISSFTGVYGVSFLVVWTSVSLLSAGLLLLRPSASRTMLFAEVVPPLLVVSIVFATGYHRLTHAPESGRTIRLTSIQPSIPQTMIWDSSANAKRFAELMALTESALSNQADALLWPEAALPELSEANFGALTNLAGAHNTWFIFGADDVRYRPGSTNEGDLLYYNAAWLLSPRGQIADIYYKRRLVIFGEYIPLADWLPFIKWFTPITGGFQAGTNASQFAVSDAQVTAAPLICFEDCFPHGAREHVTEDTDLLVNLTNDGWFGEGAEQWQHAANAVFRAIENGLPLVRSCNNGVTCWIDPQGRIRDILRDEQGTIYGAGHITFTIPLNPRPPGGTFYTRHGDVFGWACTALSVLAVARSRFRSRGSRPS